MRLLTSSAVVCAPRGLSGRGGRHHGDLRQVILHHVCIEIKMKFRRFAFFSCTKFTFRLASSSGPQSAGQVPCRASIVMQPVVWWCRWAGVLPSAPTCCTTCVSSLWPSGFVTVCGCSSVAAPQKGSRGVERGGLAPRAV